MGRQLRAFVDPNRPPLPLAVDVDHGGIAHKTHAGSRAKEILEAHISPTAIVNTDTAAIYSPSHTSFVAHDRINHTFKEYSVVDPWTGRRISTNTVEGYFGNFRRQLDGTHHHVSVGHLHRYSSEFEFKYNSRKVKDGARVIQTMKRLEGRRLTLFKVGENVPSLQD